MLNAAQLRIPDLLPRRTGTPFAELPIPALGRSTGEGDSLVLLRLLLRAQASAFEYQLTAAEAAKRGAKLIAAFSAEASAMEGQLAKRAAEVGRKLGDSEKKERGT